MAHQHQHRPLSAQKLSNLMTLASTCTAPRDICILPVSHPLACLGGGHECLTKCSEQRTRTFTFSRTAPSLSFPVYVNHKMQIHMYTDCWLVCDIVGEALWWWHLCSLSIVLPTRCPHPPSDTSEPITTTKESPPPPRSGILLLLLQWSHLFHP